MRAPPAERAQAPLEPRDLGEQRAEGADRVHARLGHRAVRHPPADEDARPDDAALLEAQLVLLGLADDRGVELAAGRRRAEVLRAEHVALLVDQRADDELAAEGGAAPLDRRGGEHRGGEPALHVGRPASVDAPVHELGAEGRVRPLRRRALGDDVGVTLEQKALAAPLLAEPGDDVRPARRDLVDLEREAFFPKEGLDAAGDRGLVGARLARPHDARDPDELARQLDELVGIDAGERSLENSAPGHGRLLVREGQDDRVQPDDAVLLARDVEVMALDLFGGFLERDDGAQLRHVPEGVGALVEAVAARHHLAVADRRALRTVHAHVRRPFRHEPNEEIDSVNLYRNGLGGHRANYTTPLFGLDFTPLEARQTCVAKRAR